jgi:hypothetical protein
MSSGFPTLSERGPAYVARTSQGETMAVEEEQLGLVADGVLAHPLGRVTA